MKTSKQVSPRRSSCLLFLHDFVSSQSSVCSQRRKKTAKHFFFVFFWRMRLMDRRSATDGSEQTSFTRKYARFACHSPSVVRHSPHQLSCHSFHPCSRTRERKTCRSSPIFNFFQYYAHVIMGDDDDGDDDADADACPSSCPPESPFIIRVAVL